MDLLRDFAYARVTVDVPSASVNALTTVTVDDTSRLPSNTELAASEFWMTLESDLNTGAFEIVRVLSKTTNTIQVMRGQEGSAVYAHPSGVYVKASISANMLRRLTGYKRYVDLGNFVVSGQSTFTAAVPVIYKALASSTIGGSATTAAVTRDRNLAGSCACLATTAGILTNFKNLSTVVHGMSSVAGQITKTSRGSSVSTGVSTAGAALNNVAGATSTTYGGRTYASGTY